MNNRSFAKTAYVAMAGFLFAILQTGFFFQLQCWMTADYPSYLTVTLAWLFGNIVGLWVGGRQSARTLLVWLGASLVSYYAVLGLLRCFPYQMRWLTVDGMLIAICGLQVGHFFAVNRSLFNTAARLFFWENNGFILGWIAGFVGYAWFGTWFHWSAPAIMALILGGFSLCNLREPEASLQPQIPDART